MDILFLCDHVNNLARVESVCTFDGSTIETLDSISFKVIALYCIARPAAHDLLRH